jgi:hypothetical protein
MGLSRVQAGVGWGRGRHGSEGIATVSRPTSAIHRDPGAEALFRVVDAAYEKRSIAISSNIHPSGFDELMPKRSGPPPSTGSCTTPTS